MMTLGEIINEISKIQTAIDSVEVRGYENRKHLNAAYERCSNLITAINQVAQEIQNGGNSADKAEHPEEG